MADDCVIPTKAVQKRSVKRPTKRSTLPAFLRRYVPCSSYRTVHMIETNAHADEVPGVLGPGPSETADLDCSQELQSGASIFPLLLSRT
jgi:hypothetical protein